MLKHTWVKIPKCVFCIYEPGAEHVCIKPVLQYVLIS